MNRRSNYRGTPNRNNQNNQNYQQQYKQHFVPANGNSNNQTPQKQQQQQQTNQQAQQQQKPVQQQQPQQQIKQEEQVVQEQKPQQPQQQTPQKNQNNTQQSSQPDPPIAQSTNVAAPLESAADDSEGGIGAKMRKIFANRKNLSPAERKRLVKERKARQLRRLRKLLSPKNAVVALHELQGPGMSEFVVNTSGQETTAEIVVNNVRYEATASSKHLAKSRASEKALRDLVIAQMNKARQAAEKQLASNGNSSQNEDVEMEDVSEQDDDVPMLHLASYALFKLFTEWQNEGFEIPAIKPQKAPIKLTEAGVHPLAPKVAKTKADLPADAATRHPSALLAFMRPQVPYEDLGSNNSTDPAQREFSVGVTVDGQRFVGKARNKKLARKEAAATACQTLFDVKFIETATTTSEKLSRGFPQQEKRTADSNNKMMPMDDEQEGGIGAKMRKIFANRKNMSSADRKRLEKERKARQLRRLRKLLTPKNAVVALHELQGPGMSEFVINTNGQETTAEIVVNNVRYEATASNKHLAKARASEKALRDLVIAQMAKARQNAEKQETNGTDENEDVEMNDVSESDEVPMLHLASYALYKLFNEWQNEGFEIPSIKPTKSGVKLNEAGSHPLTPKVAKTKADLPVDAATRHPTALLAFMRPQIPYEDLGSNNNPDPAKREFSVGVAVDGQRFIGKARSKKAARKEAAAAACRELFDVQFVESTAA
ncbi:uncharacterized protein LOC129761601 [Toxorhynchites rutilus septentrionalis]|uniref:uncharacterized protein LOC129761601 n=1 Tax=Toxorhynchites rutilus septentrionalis TaxID=329112 RepID=UPI00247A4972|nr:uncharacterized protein LOC129761601 [Toxorhynchites rutilus septentrionalis]